MKAIPSIPFTLLVIGHGAANATVERLQVEPFGTAASRPDTTSVPV